jgi:RNA polymerase subunit RPABC4/transcription elongation factor Spt4
MDFENILNTIRPFVVMFAALFVAFLTATWVAAVIWAFRDIRSRTRDIFAQILATLLVFVFFPLFPVPGLILYFLLRPRETLSDVYERSLEEEALLQGIEERMACPSCNRRIEEDFLICPSCHTRLKKPCPACGRRLHLKWHICPYCGEAQTGTRMPAPPAHAFVLPPEGEPESRMLAGAPASSLPEPEAYGVDTPVEPLLEDDAEAEPETEIVDGFDPYADSEVDDTWEPLWEDGVDAEPETEEVPVFEPDPEPDADADADAEALPEDMDLVSETDLLDVPEPDAEPDADEDADAEPIPEDDAEAEADADAEASADAGADAEASAGSEPDTEQPSVESD